MQISHGSTWHKWDLHIHTPYSIEQEYGDSKNPEVWEKFIKSIENLPEEIKAIGINDYYTFKGYKKVIEYKRQGRMPRINLILPIVELRTRNITGNFLGETNRINYHVIFSNLLDVEIIEREFLNQLKCDVNFSGTPIKISLSDDSLCTIGKAYKASQTQTTQNPVSDLVAGFNTFEVSIEEIMGLLNRDVFNNKYLTAIGYAEWNNIKWSQSPGQKKTLINNCDFCLTAAPTIDQFDAHRNALIANGVNPKLIHSSDAHFYDKVCSGKDLRYIGNTYTWIKSELSFEGLRQLQFEYDERCKASHFIPQNKSAQLVIDRIQFHCADNDFGLQELGLSENLNAIIGGKSSGKSILLYAIAKSIDSEQVDALNKLQNINGYNFGSNFNFKVYWKDGEISSFPSNSGRSVTYIPQLYINYIAENNNSKSGLNRIVLDVLKSRREFLTVFEGLSAKLQETQNELHKTINEFHSKSILVNEKHQKIRALGVSEGFKVEIAQIDENMTKLQSISQFTQEEIDAYRILATEQELVQANIAKTDLELLAIKKLQEATKGSSSAIGKRTSNTIAKNIFQDVHLVSDTSDRVKEIVVGVLDQIESAIAGIFSKYDNNLAKIQELSQSERRLFGEQLDVVLKKIAKYSEKLSSQKQYQELVAKRNELVGKIQEINKLNEELKQLNIDHYITDIIEAHKRVDTVNSDLLALCSRFSKFPDEDQIKLICELGFDHDKFQSEFSSKFINRRKLKDQLKTTSFDDDDVFLYSPSTYLTDIEKILRVIISSSDQLSLKKGNDINSIIHGLYSNYIYLKFDIEKSGDKLLKMSPGKKGLTLFQLFLQLNNSASPILIDQPEDNLDNRTVFAALNEYVRKKKIDRQIIMVTHNPNLVVTTDSENVIVANQQGQGSGENVKFKFEYINGPLENDFIDSSHSGILNTKGIKQHVCEILEGGEDAFRKRESRYQFKIG